MNVVPLAAGEPRLCAVGSLKKSVLKMLASGRIPLVWNVTKYKHDVAGTFIPVAGIFAWDTSDIFEVSIPSEPLAG
jgi:hypothetical protein